MLLGHPKTQHLATRNKNGSSHKPNAIWAQQPPFKSFAPTIGWSSFYFHLWKGGKRLRQSKQSINSREAVGSCHMSRTQSQAAPVHAQPKAATVHAHIKAVGSNLDESHALIRPVQARTRATQSRGPFATGVARITKPSKHAKHLPSIFSKWRVDVVS